MTPTYPDVVLVIHGISGHPIVHEEFSHGLLVVVQGHQELPRVLPGQHRVLGLQLEGKDDAAADVQGNDVQGGV